MSFYFKALLILIIFALNMLHASDTLWDRPYTPTTEPPLHDKFAYFSETESLECNGVFSPTSCVFRARTDAHLGWVIFILVITFFLMAGLIGDNPDRADPYGGGISLSEKAKERINQRPIQWIKALIVFAAALLLVQYIRADLTDKRFDFSDHLVTIQKAGTDQMLETIPFQTIAAFELMKYKTKEYMHYEVNLRLKAGKRIHLYAGKDKILCTSAAIELSEKLGIGVEKLIYSGEVVYGKETQETL